jgi:hypothetical protein
LCVELVEFVVDDEVFEFGGFELLLPGVGGERGLGGFGIETRGVSDAGELIVV